MLLQAKKKEKHEFEIRHVIFFPSISTRLIHMQSDYIRLRLTNHYNFIHAPLLKLLISGSLNIKKQAKRGFYLFCYQDILSVSGYPLSLSLSSNRSVCDTR